MTFFAQLARDGKYALRGLRRQPSFACAAIAVLVLGVGATTSVFSVLRGVLITPLPYRDPGQLVLLRAQLPGATSAPMLTSLEFATLRAQTDLFESVAAVVESDGNLTAPGAHGATDGGRRQRELPRHARGCASPRTSGAAR